MVITEISLVLFLCLLGLCIGDGNPGGGGSVSSIVTQEFFNNIINEAGNGCTGEKFYTRNSFIAAADSFPDFTTSVTKREIAAMFAHFTHETGHFCYIAKRKKKPPHDSCDENIEQTDCPPPSEGRGYFRRGQSLSLHFLRQSELVASNPTVTFRTGLRLWMNSVRPVLNQGFGATIRAISGVECNAGNSGAVNARIGYYKAYCGQLGVDPGPNLSC